MVGRLGTGRLYVMVVVRGSGFWVRGSVRGSGSGVPRFGVRGSGFETIASMRQMAVLLLLSGALLSAQAPAGSLHDSFNAKQAFAYTAQVAGFGERPPGSPGHQKTQALIKQVLTKNGAQIETDDFTAKTPRGPVEVHNII